MRHVMSEFNYPEMTPELQAYLNCGSHPGYKYPEDENGKPSFKPTPESAAAVDAWRAKLHALEEHVGEVALNRYHRAHVAWFCRAETQQGEPQTVTAPSGKYQLVVTQHYTEQGCWSYTKGEVQDAQGKPIATVCRNYGSFLHAWVENHAHTGKSYLICGEDYQGQSVVELDTGEVRHYLPSAAHDGHGFCWVIIHPSPDGSLLAVEGCYWACPYEVRVYDFSKPLTMPWIEFVQKCESENFLGWDGSDTCSIGGECDVVNLPGHRLDGKSEWEMSGDELEEIQHLAEAQGLTENAYYKLRQNCQDVWHRPSNFEAAKQYAEYLHKYWIKAKREVPEDFLAMLELHLARVTPEELELIRAAH